MGRARGGIQKVAVGEFNSILGSRRGSRIAQAGRDLSEKRVLEDREINDFLVQIRGGGNDPLPLVESLVSSYRAHSSPEVASALLLAAVRQNPVFSRTGALNELTAIAVRKDPSHCPGLTAPAAQALTQYFSASQTNEKDVVAGYSKTVVGWLAEAQRNKPKHGYRGLEALVAALVLPLAPESGSSIEDVAALGVGVASALGDAPDAALAGPLRSWIDVFVSRFDSKLLSARERQELRKIFVRHTPAGAFAPRSAAAAAALAKLKSRV